MNRFASLVVLAQLVSNVPGRPDAGVPDAAPDPGSLSTTFHLNAIYREQGASSIVPIPLNGTDGAVPVTAPKWSCLWALRPAPHSTSLVVECRPFDHDQSVSTAVACDTSAPTRDYAVVLLTTRDNFQDDRPSHVTELKLVCQTAR